MLSETGESIGAPCKPREIFNKNDFQISNHPPLLARTIADLAGSEEIQSVQVADKSNDIICPSPALFLESFHGVRPSVIHSRFPAPGNPIVFFVDQRRHAKCPTFS